MPTSLKPLLFQYWKTIKSFDELTPKGIVNRRLTSWHFHIRSANGEIFLPSESYARKQGPLNAASVLRKHGLPLKVVLLKSAPKP